ncbi:MAG TPA: hypothetical protein H9684_09775 [Firmicutes bacterium]|nr:hypothetical protein [Bacillota bacterium]
MRTAATVAKVIMWIALVFYVILQVATILSIQLGNNATAAELGRPEDAYNIVPLLVTTAAMLAAVILFTVWEKRRYIGVVVAILAGVAIVVIAFDLGRAFPVRISGYDTDPGLSTWKLVWRHIGMVLVPLAMIPAWLCERTYMKSREFQLSLSREPTFDLSGAAIFSDGGETAPPQGHRLKKSLRRKQQAAERARKEE